MSDRFHWARLLAFVSGLVNQELLLRNEYLAAENRILRAHLPSRLRLSDAERSTLAEIAKRLGRKALKEIARVAKPDTILASGIGDWSRRSSTAPGIVPIPAGLESHLRWKRWWSAWRAKTAAGDMTGLRARWRIWAIRSRIERSATSSVGIISLQRPRGVERRPGRNSSLAQERARRGRFLYPGSADLARSGHVLRAVLH